MTFFGTQTRILGKMTGIAVACLVFALCSAKARGEESVTYRLKWLINMSTVGDVYARVHGYFQAQGLSVEIKPGGPERDAIRELELGYANFGVASADQVVRALDKGAPLVVLAQLFQVNPLQWMYRPDRVRIQKPDDLNGKTIGVTFGKNDEFIMRTLLARAGISLDQVRLFSVRLDYTPFYSGEVDLWPVYINTQGIEIESKMKKAGDPLAFFEPQQHGVLFVANSVVTSEKMLTKRTQTVRRFMRGLLKGWQASLNPAAAERSITAVRRFDRDTTRETMKAQWATTRSLVQPDPSVAIGTIDEAAWRQTEKIMLEYGQIQKPVNVTQHLKPVLAQ